MDSMTALVTGLDNPRKIATLVLSALMIVAAALVCGIQNGRGMISMILADYVRMCLNTA